MANLAINYAISEYRQLYILALDMKDVFGSVAHRLFGYNLECTNISTQLRKVVIDSYEGAIVNIISEKNSSGLTEIKRRLSKVVR
jgi:hypothetical protein